MCKLRLACELLTPFDCPCTTRSDPVDLDQSSWKQPYRESLSSPHACLSLRRGGSYTRKHTTTELGVCDYGPCICGDPSALRNQWSKTASEGAAFLFSLALRERGVHVRESLPCHARLSFSLRLETSVGDDERAGVERMETRRQEELAHAWDVVTHRGYVPVRTLLGTCCRDFYWPIRRRQFARFNKVVFEDLMHVWSLVSCRTE